MPRRSYGRYRLVEKIAIGGMAEVWRARQTVVEGVERDVVIKRILPHFVNDPDFVQMFLNEARVAARFNHSNIAQIYDVGEQDGTYFIAMEYVHGADLGRVMRKAWTMGHWVARPLAMRIIACCCEGLAYAHTRLDESGRPLNVVHRDVSPANILISTDGAVKLTDFGIAKASDLVSVTRAGSIKGKFAYMSPEQATGKVLDYRSDLFSAALVLYELLTGIRPLRRETDAETHAAAVQCEIQPPSEVSDVPPEVDSLVMKALAKDPDDRYPDVHHFRMALEEFLVEHRWVATSAQISELMRILFADGIKPELPPGVSQDDDLLDDPLGEADTQHRAEKSITAPQRARERGLGAAGRSTEQLDEAALRDDAEEDQRPGPPVPDEEEEASAEDDDDEASLPPDLRKTGPMRDIYGEDDPLPEFTEHGGMRESGASLTAPTPKKEWTGPPRRLDFLDGPDKGLTVRLQSSRVVVGRVADCSVHLKDRSISRRHLELSQTGDAVMLRDLASGNGTKVNGEEITERLLRHGDVIELGNTKFQYIDETEEQKLADAQISAKIVAAQKQEAAPPPPPPAPLVEAAPPAPTMTPVQRWRAMPLAARRALLASAGAAFLLLFLICVRPGHTELEPKQELAQRKLAEAKAALADGRRAEAIIFAASADRLWPGIDTEKVGETARRDQDAVERFRKVGQAIDANDLTTADAALQAADPASLELVNEKKELSLKLAAAHVRVREQAFQDALRAGDFTEARSLLAQMEPQRAAKLRGQLEENELLVKQQAQATEVKTQEVRVEDDRRRRESRRAAIDVLFRPVEQRLQSADYDRAVLAADHVVDENPGDGDVAARARDLKRLIPTFGRAYDQAQADLRRSQFDRAVSGFKRAKDVLGQLGFGGPLADKLDSLLLEATIEAGKKALADRDLGNAASYFRAAAQLSPRDARARDGLQALTNRAQDIYREAMVLRASNPTRANEQLRTVVEITPPGSELNDRARAALRP